ncbi:PAS-domain containing protein [Paracoccus aerodenitrificans]|uniref:PAS-domain containing protein n=1 Tax=Paracoccus aerodenitrificans TaxID=3017781 RepID=UPI0022F10013|nr:PAS-domain containing protein [Paracoccus aerodenitrificans]WBU63811.1 PAS-domain containing protein [Paracoccus aerodenitrificans]
MFIIRGLENRHVKASLTEGLLEPCIFLYNNEKLLDATRPAKAILDGCASSTLTSLKTRLARCFPDLSELDNMLAAEGRAILSGKDTAGVRLTAEKTISGAIRLTLVQPENTEAGIVIDALSYKAMEDELGLLREVVDNAPMLVSRRDSSNEITWVNSPYLALSETLDPQHTKWPLPDILGGTAGTDRTRRHAIPSGLDSQAAVNWYECHQHIATHGTITYALNADAKVQAEETHREFLRSLTNTFAELSIGLAVFDRQRILQLFNPALSDLTGLPTPFLTARPSLSSVLDELRDRRMVPERRDYNEWRKGLLALEAGEDSGYFAEKWSLPGDRTYRVSGRPYGGGAAVLLFEDITPEVSRVRDLREELQKINDVMNTLDEALILFDALGQALLANQSYLTLWREEPRDLSAALTLWRGDWSEAPGLAELEQKLTSSDTVSACRGVLFGPGDTGILNWSLSPLPGGRRLVRFTPASASQTAHHPKIEDNPLPTAESAS